MARQLLAFGAGARQPIGGFGYLDNAGRIIAAQGSPLWITCRMTHCFALGSLMGWPGAPALVDHGLAALQQGFADKTNGGWFAALDDAGYPASTVKQAYGHAFVVLAASSATLAGQPGANQLLAKSLEVMESRFWEPEAGAVVDQLNQDFSCVEPYRGANANMHTVEAFSAAALATGDGIWCERALLICERIINGAARQNGWRIPEHYNPDWTVNRDYNSQTPADQFRPFGATPGHGFEWARLLVQLQHHLGDKAPPWLGQAAQELYDRAVADGWEARPAPGFVYTTDFDGQPVLRTRLHWVMAEAVAAAAVLFKVTGQVRYQNDLEAWWQAIDHYFVDRTQGSWHHELDPAGRPCTTLWPGKPDIYHALQASLLPMLPVTLAVAASVRAAP